MLSLEVNEAIHGSVVGVAEFQLDCDFGRDEGRPDRPGEQAWILTMAVADAHRRHGVGRALVTEIALPGPGRRPHGVGWGCPVAQIPAAEGMATTQGHRTRMRRTAWIFAATLLSLPRIRFP
ncbi:GNAT family N-acetyltransferase [Streptomyces sp. NPDC058231]|uniref:GNAT family N-acetyltransferase n=1 Tax=Streptomyces sp. NPDC058231 TaxID=3346392 RepID=UPI0036E41CDE